MPAATTGTPGTGSQTKIWISESLPFNTTSAQCLEFQSESLQQQTSLYYNDGIRGTRSRARERVRKATKTVGGSITMTPTKTELRTLLPWILGTNETGSGTSGTPYAYILAETMQEFQVLIQRYNLSASHLYSVFLYEGCRVSRATFSASTGGPLQLTLDIEAETEQKLAYGGSATWYDAETGLVEVTSPAGDDVPTSVPDNDSIFMFSDTGGATGYMTLGNSDRECFDWSLTIDNVLDTGRYMNSLTRRNIPSLDRIVSMSATVPFTAAEDDLYDPDVNRASPDINVNLVRFYSELGTNDDVLNFTLATWNIESRSPTVNGKGEIVLALNGGIYRKNTSTVKAEVAVDIWTT